MTTSQLRKAMGAGVVFVVALVAGVLFTFGNSPETKSSDTAATAAHKWLEYLASSSHRTGLIIGAYLLVVAAIAFVWFSTGLREWFAPDVATGRVMSGLGLLGAGALALAAMTGGVEVAGGIAFGNEPLPAEGEAVRIVAGMFFPLVFVVFGLASAALIGLVALLAQRERRAPGWVGYTAWIGALGALTGVFFFPFLIALLWYLAVAIVGLLGAAWTGRERDSGFAAAPEERVTT